MGYNYSKVETQKLLKKKYIYIYYLKNNLKLKELYGNNNGMYISRTKKLPCSNTKIHEIIINPIENNNKYRANQWMRFKKRNKNKLKTWRMFLILIRLKTNSENILSEYRKKKGFFDQTFTNVEKKL